MKHLSETLLLRTIQSQEDVEQLAEFNTHIHEEGGEPDLTVGAWTRDLLNGSHPTVTWDDFLVVEDTETGKIVSSLCLIPQTWAYEGISFGVGRVELVGTHPDYRRKGLVRQQFEAIHQRCEALNLPVQGITGIYYYYRQFDYEYALDLGGGHLLKIDGLPETPTDSPFTLELWQEKDLPQLMELYEHQTRESLVTTPRTASDWRYSFTGISPENVFSEHLFTIKRDDVVVGYVCMSRHTARGRARINELCLEVPYPEISQWLVSRLRDEVQTLFPDADPAVSTLVFGLGREHPIYAYLQAMWSNAYPPYSWYIRVPDVAGFVRHIAPALSRRIAESPLRGLTQTLTLNFYTGGLQIDLNDGEVTSVEALSFEVEKAQAGFPPLVFLQLLFGYRSFEELNYAFPDVYADRATRPLLETLFPRKPSWVMPMF